MAPNYWMLRAVCCVVYTSLPGVSGTLVERAKNQTVVSGGSASFSCTTDDVTLPIDWTYLRNSTSPLLKIYSSGYINEKLPAKKYAVETPAGARSYILTVSNVTDEDTGVYTCTELADSADTSSAWLSVSHVATTPHSRTGVIIGVVVAVCVLASVIIIVFIFIYCRHNHESRHQTPQEEEHPFVPREPPGQRAPDQPQIQDNVDAVIRNVAKSTAFEIVTYNPNLLVLIDFNCTCDRRTFERSRRYWSCEICTEDLLYGYDGYFYCKCGKARCETFTLKCNSENHGTEFELFYPGTKTMLDSYEPKLNIILVGETGVGKSTWTNGFANYFAFSSLSEATEKGANFQIPAYFEVSDNENKYKISTGSDSNEYQEDGHTGTKRSRNYEFKVHLADKEVAVTIIDTPGFGDQADRDMDSLKNLILQLSGCDTLHAICFLLKPNENRLSVVFEDCFRDLITVLPANAQKIMVFCFTNTRAADYKPGDTVPMLRALLQSTPAGDHVVLDRETMFCTDNEAIRYLAARSQGNDVLDHTANCCERSWSHSTEELQRMLRRLLTIKPYPIEVTLR